MSASKSKDVSLHPSRGAAWAIFGFFALCLSAFVGLAYTGPNRSEPSIDIALFAYVGVILLLPLTMLIGAYVFYVRADDDGVSWRTFRGTHRAAWDEIADYYQTSYPVKSSQKERMVIETRRGIVRADSEWQGDRDLFRARVQERAASARASSWELRGNRPTLDWPRTFLYSPKDLRTRKIARAVAITAGPLFAALIASERISRMQREGVGPDAVYTYLTLALSGTLVWGMFGLMAIPISAQVRDLNRRRGETLEVDVDGLHFADSRDSTRDRFLPWGEIRRCCLMPAPGKSRLTRYIAVVQSENATVDFSVGLQDYALLQKIIPCHAPNVTDKEWSVVEPPLSTRAAAAQWTSGIVGVGGRAYSYRTPTLRSLTFLLTFMIGAACLAPLLRAFASDESLSASGRADAPRLLICAVLIAYLWWRYHAGGIVLYADRVAERTPLGERTMRWDDMVSYRHAGDDAFVFGVLRDRQGKRLRFHIAIDDVDELTREIAARAPQATGSWEKD